jgi:hypothetical protein
MSTPHSVSALSEAESIGPADTVRHRPSDEEWLVAFVEDGRLCACGWPCGFVPLEDCSLIRKATQAERDALLASMAALEGSDPRGRYARRVLSEAPAASGELDVRSAQDQSRKMHRYVESFNGQKWGGVDESIDRQNLATALDNLLETAAMLGNVADRLASPSGAGLGGAVASSEAVAKAFDAFLCRAWGETELPSAELATDWEGVRRFLVREWLGEEDEEALLQVHDDFVHHDENMDIKGGPFLIEFEIGGVSIERVCGFAEKGALS